MIISHHNKRIIVVSNIGVHNAKHDNNAFLDDDEWLPDYLSNMNKPIDLFHNSVMFCISGMGRNRNGVKTKDK